VLFSEPKILNTHPNRDLRSAVRAVSVLFSEPKILNPDTARFAVVHQSFQCSSASRKFSMRWKECVDRGFAEFQCSSASRKFSIVRIRAGLWARAPVSVLFSEPKILNVRVLRHSFDRSGVSVLFSEPKILNDTQRRRRLNLGSCFSALQRAENSQS